MMHTCIGPDCDREAVCKSACRAHYDQLRRRGYMTKLLPPVIPSNQPEECTAPGCTRRPVAHSVCFSHYTQTHYKGKPVVTELKPRTRKVDMPEFCTGPDCNRRAKNTGLCTSHLAQLYRRGVLTPLRAYNKRTDKQEPVSKPTTKQAGSPRGSRKERASK